MRLLLFPFFFFYLLLSLKISLLRIFFDALGFYSTLLLSLAFLLVVLYFNFFKSSATLPFFAPAASLGTADMPAEQYIQYWETMKTLQPTHRDILLNLAALYEYSGDASKAAEMKKQAKEVDPNFNSSSR